MFEQLNKEVKEIYRDVDNQMMKIDKVCRVGCSHCCHQIVDVFNWEEPIIFDHIAERLKQSDKKEVARNLKKWFKAFNSYTRPADRSNPLNLNEIEAVQHLFREKEISCPFLIRSQCAIYPVRPLACRSFFEKEDAMLCKTEKHRLPPIEVREMVGKLPGPESAKQVLMVRSSKPLAYAVVDEFNVEVKSKPLTGVMLPIE